MKRKNLLSALTILMVGFFSSGCLVVSENGHYETQCRDECEDIEICESFCDDWECWDECWIETSCDTICEEVYVETEVVEEIVEEVEEVDTSVECYSNPDCGDGKICVSNECKPKNTTDTGLSGLCQSCETNQDCSETGAVCIKLNFDMSNNSGEKVCTRACEINSECPTNFECVNVGDSTQCLPKNNDFGKRSCSANDLECVKASDCGVGESCVSNSCTSPETAECDSKTSCKTGETCKDFKCVAETALECVERKDCKSGETCIDGACEKSAESCVFNEECDGGSCVDGSCLSACSENSDCGSNERCLSGLCEALECRRTADCGGTEICVDAQCEARCTADSNCGSGFVCNANNYCEEDPNVACRNNAQCSQNEICVSGTCERPCSCNQECGSGEVCGATGVCEAPASSPAQCQTDCECASGETCSAGRCK